MTNPSPHETTPNSAADTAMADASALLFHDVPAAVYLRGVDGRFLEVNNATAALFGYADPAAFLAAMDDCPEQFYLDPNARQSVLDALAAGEVVVGRRYQAMCGDGFVIWIEESAKHTVSPAGDVFYVGFLRDVTEEKARAGPWPRPRKNTAPFSKTPWKACSR